MDQKRLAEKLEEIKQQFLITLKEELQLFLESRDVIKPTKAIAEDILKEITFAAHKISGSSRIFSFEKLGVIAKELELHTAMMLEESSTQHNDKLLELVNNIINEIEHIIENSLSA